MATGLGRTVYLVRIGRIDRVSSPPVTRVHAVRTAIASLLVGVLVVALLPAAASAQSPVFADTWKRPNIGRVPVTGPTFNDPSSRSQAAQRRSINYLNDMIALTPPGQVLRISQYNLTCGSTVDRIIAAYRRGVIVRIVLNDRVLGNDVSNRPLYRQLRNLLGTDTSKGSYFVTCDRGCRTGGGAALHTKFVSIGSADTRVGPKRYLVFTASGNITCGWAATRQYNDQYAFVGNPKVYRSFITIFEQLAQDKRPASNPYRRYDHGTAYTLWFWPRWGAHAPQDPIWQVLNQVECRSAGRLVGRSGRTVVRVNMFTWNGNRGLNLARRLFQLDQAGCHVEVIVGAPGAGVLRELRRPGRNGGIAVFDSRKDRNGDGELDLYTHMKALMISGHVGKVRNEKLVYTGSANWTPDAFTTGDELTMRLNLNTMWNRYNKNWEFIKARSTRLTNKNTTVAELKPYNLLPQAE